MKRKNTVWIGVHLDVPGNDGVLQSVGVFTRFADVFGQLGLPARCKATRLAGVVSSWESRMLDLPCEATAFVFLAAVEILQIRDHANLFVFDDDKLLVFLTRCGAIWVGPA